MKRNLLHIIITLLLISALLTGALSGCGGDAGNGAEGEQAPGQTAPGQTDSAGDTGGSSQPAGDDGRFTLRYTPGATFNPLTGTDANNMAAASLMYEGLFILDDTFTAQPVLCESWETEDGLTYTFKIKAGVAVSDGSTLTADDVAYSVNEARECEKYRRRLDCISSCIVSDERTVIMTLYAADMSLPSLLDVPIVKNGTAGDELPAGTGPYTLTLDGNPRLLAFRRHRNADKLPMAAIYLGEFSDSRLTESFAEYKLDLIREDVGAGDPLILRGNYEARRWCTTILQYVGFNAESPHLNDPKLRRAMSFAIDRASIINDICGGCGVAAPLVLPPCCSLYDEAWEEGYGFSMTKLSSTLAEIGMSDWSGDLYLEYPSGDGFFDPVSYRFIVNSENENKVAAAQLITDNLRSIGLDVTLEVLAWNDYAYRMNTGDFDMYYAEVSLTANFDITELLEPGGSLDYGGTGSAAYSILARAFLCAGTDEEKSEAAKNLCLELAENCQIIPVLYRQSAMYTHRGYVVGASPSASGIFHGFTDWVIRPAGR